MYYYQQAYYPNQVILPTQYDRKHEEVGIGKCQRVFSAILKAIAGEAAAIDLYSRLVQFAPNAEHREVIEHALSDEKVHYNKFSNLYIKLTGKQPIFKVNKEEFSSYEEGLRMAKRDEYEAYENYRNAYLLTRDSDIRDVFFHALTDEIEHATKFGFLILELK